VPETTRYALPAPGPYTISDHPGVPRDIRMVEILDDDGDEIAHVYTRERPRANATARLFVKAPDLLRIVRALAAIKAGTGLLMANGERIDFTEVDAILAYVEGKAVRRG
jgi:hypothetical protein